MKKYLGTYYITLATGKKLKATLNKPVLAYSELHAKVIIEKREQEKHPNCKVEFKSIYEDNIMGDIINKFDKMFKK